MAAMDANATIGLGDTAEAGRTKQRQTRLREAVAVFDDIESFQTAIDELQNQGFGRADLGTVADRRTVERLRGKFYENVSEIEDDATVPRVHFVSRSSLGDAEGVAIGAAVYVFAVVAALLAAAGGADIGGIILAVTLAGLAGGAVGFLGARLLERHWQRRVADQLDRGGLVLWVRIDREREDRARRILAEAGGRHLHVHEVPIPAYLPDDRDIDLVRIGRTWPTAWWRP